MIEKIKDMISNVKTIKDLDDLLKFFNVYPNYGHRINDPIGCIRDRDCDCIKIYDVTLQKISNKIVLIRNNEVELMHDSITFGMMRIVRETLSENGIYLNNSRLIKLYGYTKYCDNKSKNLTNLYNILDSKNLFVLGIHKHQNLITLVSENKYSGEKESIEIRLMDWEIDSLCVYLEKNITKKSRKLEMTKTIVPSFIPNSFSVVNDSFMLSIDMDDIMDSYNDFMMADSWN